MASDKKGPQFKGMIKRRMSMAKKESLIHKIRDIDLVAINVDEEYDVLKEIGSGDYGKVLLACNKQTGTQVRRTGHQEEIN